MNAYDQWLANLRAVMSGLGFRSIADPRWAAAWWPFQDDHFGEPAARFSPDAYVTVYNSGNLPSGEGTQENKAGTWIYVLASAMTGNDDVVRDAPTHTMTLTERAANAVFTAGDVAAEATGLPSLSSIESGLKTAGYVVVGLAALAAYAMFFRRGRS